MGPARFLISALVSLLFLFSWGALRQSLSSDTDPAKLNADVVRTMKAYKASLEKLLKIYEQDFKKKVGEVQEHRRLYEKGYVSRSELDESQQELASAEAKLKETEEKIVETKIAIAEASALEEFLRIPPLAAGQYMERGALIRYNGKANWSLADAGEIRRFFAEKFGRMLPVSAWGQTPFHQRMKFDHRDAMDVALHPDSSEGRALLAYLRQTGIPFTAFRDGVPGSATGAHIHIGRPSLRAAR